MGIWLQTRNPLYCRRMTSFDILVEKATKNVGNVLTHAIELGQGKAIVIYDEDSELSRVLTQAYKAVLPEQDFVLFGETTADDILARIDALSPGDMVILVQSTNFRLSEFRIRIELFKRDLKTIEHVHLARMSEDQSERYIDTLAYDPNYYRPLGRALKKRIDNCSKVVVECPGTKLVYDCSFEEARLNVGDYSQMKNTGGTFPIGEVFSEASDLTKVNGEIRVFGYPTVDHAMKESESFTCQIKEGILSCEDGPEDFQELLKLIETRSPVHVREFGLGLNPAIGSGRLINDVTAFERMLGMHMSLGAKHSVYKKPGFKRKDGGFHIDIFLDLERILIDDEVVYENGGYTVGLV